MVLLARKMGWTLDYVESLGILQFGRVEAILDGVDRAESYVRQRNERRAAARRR